jgi:DNA-binding transcriptional regulator of glucitol operon
MSKPLLLVAVISLLGALAWSQWEHVSQIIYFLENLPHVLKWLLT